VTSIGAVAAELGLTVETLRYYERAGLSAPARDRSGRRDYSAFDVDQLQLVTALRSVGVPIASIRMLLAAKIAGAPARSTAERALEQLAGIDAVLRSRQAQLEDARQLIAGWASQIEEWLGAVPAGDSKNLASR
jgi:DNA-binding transcriptional MerR regulator